MYSVPPEHGSASLAARLWFTHCLLFPLFLLILFAFFFLPSWAFYGLVLIGALLIIFSVRWAYALAFELVKCYHDVVGQQGEALLSDTSRSTK